MKKSYFRYALTAVAAMLAVSCHEVDGIDNDDASTVRNRLAAALESDDTRTELGSLAADGYKNLWSADDRICVYVDGIDRKFEYKLDEGAGETRATFAGHGCGASYAALYPWSAAVGFDGSKITLSLPAKQTYVRGSFGPDSYPMVAVSDNDVLRFKNLCAVLKVSLTGLGTVRSITFSANDPTIFVSGEATVGIGYADEPSMTMSAGGSSSVTLDCNGIQLNTATPEDFYIVVPAATYRGGFTLKIDTATGYMLKSTTQDVVMERSQLRAVPSFVLRIDEGLSPSEALAGEGTGESPFIIRSLEDLMLMQLAVNGFDETIRSADSDAEAPAQTACYRLDEDIDLSPYYNYIDSWIPAGNYSADSRYVFNGSFDGDGHTIKNLKIATSSSYQGLFGYVPSGEVRNLHFEAGNVRGGDYAGMVCGRSGGTIAGCTSDGAVNGADYQGGIVGEGCNIYDCTNRAAVTGDSHVGGIAGRSSGTLRNCFNVAGINAQDSYSGGITGEQVGGYIYNSGCGVDTYISSNLYAGGICGASRGGAQIVNCYSAAMSVFVFGGYAGGISGSNETAGDSAETDTAIMNCACYGMVQAYYDGVYATCTGGIAGGNDAAVRNCYWLYDIYSSTTKGVGVDNGISERVAMLVDNQMNGTEPSATPLYTDDKGLSYTNIIDAMNAWAHDNMVPGGWCSGWTSDDHGPVLTGEKAVHPGTGETVSINILRVSHVLSLYTIPFFGGNGVSGVVDWGDSQSEAYKPSLSHKYGNSLTVRPTGRETEVTLTLEDAESFRLENLVGVSAINLSEF